MAGVVHHGGVVCYVVAGGAVSEWKFTTSSGGLVSEATRGPA